MNSEKKDNYFSSFTLLRNSWASLGGTFNISITFIKPFLYSGALEHGFTLASLVNDAPIDQWDRSSGVVWRPKNSPPTYDGPIRVRLALAQSKNVVAVRLLQQVGLSKTIDHLSSFIRSKIK